MPVTIQMTLWGPRDGSELACEANWQEQEALISRHVRRALAHRMPTLGAPHVCVAEDCRLRAGVRRFGYAMTIVVVVDAKPRTPAMLRALELQMEALVTVALLELLRPIEVEAVETVEAQAGDDSLSA